MTIIDFRLRPPLKGFLGMILYAYGERRDRITRIRGFKPAASAQTRPMEKYSRDIGAIQALLGNFSGAKTQKQ